MAKFTVTVCNISTVEVEAEDEKSAYAKIDMAIATGTDGVMGKIVKNQIGWEVTAVDSAEDLPEGSDPEAHPSDRAMESDEDGLEYTGSLLS